MLNLLVSVKGSLTGISGGDGHVAATASSLAMTSFGILLTGSMSAGFAIGFMKDDDKDAIRHKRCISLKRN